MSDAAITVIVTGIVTILTLWLKQNYESKQNKKNLEVAAGKVEAKVDKNTELTEAGTSAAAEHAKDAADVAKDVRKRINGGLDHAIAIGVDKGIEPLRREVREHAAQDERNMQEIRDSIHNKFVTKKEMDEFIKYDHQRNHDMLDKMQAINNNLSVIALKITGVNAEDK